MRGGFVALLILVTMVAFPQEVMDDFVVTSMFGDNRGDHYHSGIDLAGTDKPVFSIDDAEVIFMNKNRSGSVKYGSGNFVMLENKESKIRYNYSHLADSSYDENIKSYSMGEFLGLSGNSGHSTGKHLHFEVEDTKTHKVLNPLSMVRVKDTRRPVIRDVFFIDINKQKVSLFKTRRIVRGGKLFISAFDYVDGNSIELTPYSIEVFINGDEFSAITLDSLSKRNEGYYVGNTQKDFQSLYETGEENLFFLREQYFLPGLFSIKVVVRDFAGNASTLVVAFRVLAK